MGVNVSMVKLFFEPIPIYSIWYTDGTLRLDPFIGDRKLKHGKPISLFFKYFPKKLQKRKDIRREIVFYIIYYPGFFKIGSSSLLWVTSRVYSQAPLAGILSLAVETSESIDLDTLENECSKYIRRNLGINIHSKRSSESGFDNVFHNYVSSIVENNGLETIDFKTLANTLTRASNLLCEYIINSFEEEVTILYKPFDYVFKTKLSKGDVEILKGVLSNMNRIYYNTRILENSCRNSSCFSELTILNNGICAIRYNSRYVITTCDRIQYNFLFKLRAYRNDGQ